MRSMAKLLYRRDKWFTTGLEELLQSWCCASDLESFEHIAKEATRFVAGPVSASSFSTLIAGRIHTTPPLISHAMIQI